MGKNKSIAKTVLKQPEDALAKPVVGKTVHPLKLVLFAGISVVIVGAAIWLYHNPLPDLSEISAPKSVRENTPPSYSQPQAPIIPSTQPIAAAAPVVQPKVTEVKYIIPETVTNSINRLSDQVGKMETLNNQYMNIKADSSALISLSERVDQLEKRTKHLSKISNNGALILTAVQLIKENIADGQSVRLEAEILKQLSSAQPEIEKDINYIYNNASRQYPSDKNLVMDFNRISQRLTTNLKNEGNWKERLLRKVNEYIHISSPKIQRITDETEVLKQIKSYVDEDRFAIALEILSKPENQKLMTDQELKEWYNLTDSKLKFKKALSHISMYSLALMKTEGLKNDVLETN